ncbi:MAG TPA: N-acetyltransferase family protein [Candidatus Hydrogenedentes bacterium]|nr:N-acetyltransferase family protein [Candidatus Hydrogenedentota bacterium]
MKINHHNTTIRRAKRGDLSSITEIYNYYVEHTQITFDLEPQSLENREEWFSQFDESGAHQIVVAEVDGVIGGYAGSTKLRPKPAYERTIETTIYVHPQHMGLGLGRALYGELFGLLAVEEVHRAYGVIALPNDPSIALHKSFSFKHVGTLNEVGHKFNEYIDVAWYEKAM